MKEFQACSDACAAGASCPVHDCKQNLVGSCAEQAQPVAWRTALERIADAQNTHFGNDARVVAQLALKSAPPPRQPWVGLTDEEIGAAYDDYQAGRISTGFNGAVRAIEAKLKEKNGNPPRQPVDTEALAAELRNALAWGMAFGPVIPENQWHKERDAQVSAAPARLAAPPQRQPLTPEQIKKGFKAQNEQCSLLPRIEAFTAGVKFGEAAHGITKRELT